VAGEDARTAAVIAALAAARDPRCGTCGAAICGHEIVASHAMGYKQRPCCLACIAAALSQPLARWRDELLDYVQRRECWRAGWAWSSAHEGHGSAIRPACLWPADAAAVAVAPAAAPLPADWPPTDERWDAGDMACGDLLFELRLKVRALAPGQRIHVVARDSSAPIDMPAWCRLTAHALLAASHPNYVIERRAEP